LKYLRPQLQKNALVLTNENMTSMKDKEEKLQNGRRSDISSCTEVRTVHQSIYKFSFQDWHLLPRKSSM